MSDSQPFGDHADIFKASLSHNGIPVPHNQSFDASASVNSFVALSMFIK